MKREEIFEFVKKQYGTEPEYPWNDMNAVLRHKDNKKWYAVVMKVSSNKFGLSENKILDILNVKCDPILIGSLRQQNGFFPAYHMNKDRWISVSLNDIVPDDDIKNLIDLSFELTNTNKHKP